MTPTRINVYNTPSPPRHGGHRLWTLLATNASALAVLRRRAHRELSDDDDGIWILGADASQLTRHDTRLRLSSTRHPQTRRSINERKEQMAGLSDIATLRRQLKIKAGATARLKKEHDLYQKETVDLTMKKDRLVADGADGWDVKNATRMMEESEKMITDTAERLARAYGELRDVVVLAKKEPGLTEDEEYLKAEGILEDAAL
ncbi:BHLH domain-containing protein [Mycena kentingensis (nom. inval.)]|nr:BHLH domain-containing protein [Mycena kentingensis (nom. inval.)]